MAFADSRRATTCRRAAKSATVLSVIAISRPPLEVWQLPCRFPRSPHLPNLLDSDVRFNMMLHRTCLHLDCIIAGGCFPKGRDPLPAQSTIPSPRQDYSFPLSWTVCLSSQVVFASGFYACSVVSNLCLTRCGKILGGKIDKFGKQAADKQVADGICDWPLL